MAPAPMNHLFLGGHPATDFLNTRPTPHGAAIELVGDGTSYAAWLDGAGLLPATTASTLRPGIYGNGPVAGLRAGGTPPDVRTRRSAGV
jgi:hypothetical protein